MSDKLGKIIVFEGGDASGKGTQSKLLYEYLIKLNIKAFYLDFPQYDTFYGQLVGKFLRGELGELKDVSPYFASLTFALDRMSKKEDIIKKLNEGYTIIANRYVTSNVAHQAVKFENEKERNEFINWLEELEYKENGLPKEDAVIYLDVPHEISARLLEQKGERSYLGANKDIQEQDSEYQKRAIKLYQQLSQENSHWIKISCVKNDILKPIPEIHNEIIEILRKRNLI